MRKFGGWAAWTTLLVFACQQSASSATRAKGLENRPDFAVIRAAVQRHFLVRDIQPGEIIARGEVQALLPMLARMGWHVPRPKSLLGSIPGDRSFLVQQLRGSGKAGRLFMRQIAGLPGGYDRLDRLSRIPQGHQTIVRLLQGPDGHKMVEYMTSSHGGSELGKMLSRAPGGKQFNQPTGRIYTTYQLVHELQRRYKAPSATKKPSAKAEGSGRRESSAATEAIEVGESTG